MKRIIVRWMGCAGAVGLALMLALGLAPFTGLPGVLPATAKTVAVARPASAVLPAISGTGTDSATVNLCNQNFDWQANTGNDLTVYGYFAAEWDNTGCGLIMQTRVLCAEFPFGSYWKTSGEVESAGLWDYAICNNITDIGTKGQIRWRVEGTDNWSSWKTEWSH